MLALIRSLSTRARSIAIVSLLALVGLFVVAWRTRGKPDERAVSYTELARIAAAEVVSAVRVRGESVEVTTAAGPVTVFLSPPFADYENRAEDLLLLVGRLQQGVPVDSVICLQGEQNMTPSPLPDHDHWDCRRYGRNELWFWSREAPNQTHAERNGEEPVQETQ